MPPLPEICNAGMTDPAAAGTGRRRRGSGMLFILVVLFIFAFVVGAASYHAGSDMRLTSRSLQYQKARMAAEMGLEYGVNRLRDYILAHGLRDTNNTLQAQMNGLRDSFTSLTNTLPNMGLQWDRDLEITADPTLHEDELITLGTHFRGMQGDFRYFTITSHAHLRNSSVEANLQIRLQAVALFLIRYAIFYDGDLEFFPGPIMTVTGPVHSNSRLFLGSDGSRLTFMDRVTTVASLYANVGKDGRTFSGTLEAYDSTDDPESFVRSGSSGTHVLDSRWPEWVSESLQVWDGEVMNGAHGVTSLRPPIAPVDNPGELIQRPLSPGSPGYQPNTEAEKFANKAEIVITVSSSGTITARNEAGANLTGSFNQTVRPATNSISGGRPIYRKDSNGNYVLSGNGVIDTSQSYFYDDRENRSLAPVDIYVDRLVAKMDTIGQQGNTAPGLIYVTRDTASGSGARMPVVRLRNARDLVSSSRREQQGLSIVSDLPMYIEGDFNTVDKTSSMVAGDAVTILSKNWQDANSDKTLDNRGASSTANNVVIMTGNTNTSGSQYNGGVENVLRFLENWTGDTLTYRGSLLDLWLSRKATSPWSYGSYYTAPNRDWGYDEDLRTHHRPPPGIPYVNGLEEIVWTEISPAEARTFGVGGTY